MKKRILICLLAACLACAVCACGGSKGNAAADSGASSQAEPASPAESGTEAPADQGEPEDAGAPAEYERDADGIVVLHEDELDSFSEVVELTVDNAGDYLGLEDTCFVGAKDLDLRFSNRKERWIESEEWETVTAQEKGLEYFSIDELSRLPARVLGWNNAGLTDYTESDCIQAGGSMMLLNIPDELWTEKDGQDVIYFGSYLVQRDWHRLYDPAAYDGSGFERFQIELAAGEIPLSDLMIDYLLS